MENEEKKKAIFLSVCGAQAYDLLKNLLQPEKLADKRYDELIAVLENHYEPKQSVIVQRYKFNIRVCLSGESVAAYVAALKSIGEHCNFSKLEEMVRDRLVCRVGDARMQRAMLQERDLMYQKALELCMATELATKDISVLQQKLVEEVKRVHTSQQSRFTRSKNTSCYRCGGNHSPDTCWFKTAECRFCKKIGHIAKVCKSRLRHTPTPQSDTNVKKKRLHLVERDSSLTPLEPTSQPQAPQEGYTLFTTIGCGKAIGLTVNVNKVDLPMELDTGASISVISEVTYYSLFRACKVQPSSLSIKFYTGQEIVILGEIEVNVQYAGQEAVLPLVVVEGQGASLLGRNWLAVLNLNWPSIKALHFKSPLDSLIAKHKKLFSTHLGTLKGTSAKRFIESNAVPRFFKPRPVPYCLKEKVEKELDRLVDMNLFHFQIGLHP